MLQGPIKRPVVSSASTLYAKLGFISNHMIDTVRFAVAVFMQLSESVFKQNFILLRPTKSSSYI